METARSWIKHCWMAHACALLSAQAAGVQAFKMLQCSKTW